MDRDTRVDVNTGEGKRLSRELSVWAAIGLSIALMAPSMAANINPQGTGKVVGRAVPLAFALATLGVLLVSYTFVRLCQRFNHSGSVYAFVGATLGPRWGVVSGWALLGTYTFYGVVTSTAAGIFGAAFLDAIGVWDNPPEQAPFLLTAIALVGVFLLAIARVRGGTRLLLIVEVATVALILVVSVVVLVKLLGGSAPGGQTFTLDVFKVPQGTGVSTLFLGVVFGFLSFAGFEAAATLGEETRQPRKDIPRAILGTAIFGGIYFVFVTAVEVMGFGADEAGVKAFNNSGSLLGDLGTSYVAAWVGDLITFGTAVSAFGCALASTVAAARLLFALGRDGIAPGQLASVSPTRRTPVAATIAVVAAIYLTILLLLIFGAKPFDVFLWSGVIGTLILLVAYGLATVGVIKLLFFSGGRTVPGWEIVIPALALIVLAYTLYRNVIPYPHGGAFFWIPIVCLGWLVVGAVIVLVRPGAARRAGARLTQDEGLTTAEEGR